MFVEKSEFRWEKTSSNTNSILLSHSEFIASFVIPDTLCNTLPVLHSVLASVNLKAEFGKVFALPIAQLFACQNLGH